MSIQAIINRSNGLEMNRRKLVGIQYTRNESSRTSLTPTYNPWRFNVELPDSLKYSDARGIIEELDRLDRIYPETITFNNNPNMSWIFRYQGVASFSQLSQITVTSFVGNQLVLGNLPALGTNSVLFAANDLIQLAGRPHPFTSTTQVLRGSGNTVTVTTNRPNIFTSSAVGAAIVVGAGCQFRVFCPNMPTYKLVPGGGTYSSDDPTVITNNAYIEWSDKFSLYEYLGDLT
ncbi:hypothetical protein UFOVP623_24 [uncultured Caudovirales phage]|uniref:Uncharacterized protein n=1 Tax=uncultured Caudovirales phage TaxID=2100421 RepID=A0A6J5N1C2_9CAUD|nr:hypothetical protein UFOVP623_24 [uncultured Caudovirales phage]